MMLQPGSKVKKKRRKKKLDGELVGMNVNEEVIVERTS
jgi:hypothetical protein